MRFLRALFQWTAETLKLSLAAIPSALLIVIVLTSGWHYALVNGDEKRCFAVYLPGYVEYVDWDHGPATIRSIFSMRCPYRIGPWIDPEWIEHEYDPNFVPEEDEDASRD